MKSSVSSYSFQYAINNEGLTQLSLIEKAREIGFDAIEFTDLSPIDNLTETEYAKKIRQEADRVGIEISGYSVSADLLSGCNGNIKDEIERIKRKVDVAEILGVKMMRHDATFHSCVTENGYRGFSQIVDGIANACREITCYAEQKGIKTMVENHGMICQDSDRVEMLVNRVNHKNFGVQLDIGNFLCVDEKPEIAVGKLASYAFNVHLKDFLYKSGMLAIEDSAVFKTRSGNYLLGTVLGHGVVPINQCVEIIKKSGYDGYLTLEFEGCERLDYALNQGFSVIKKFL